MLNRVELIGHVGADPETRHTQAGKAIVNLSLATSESWKDEHGSKHERTEWHRLVIFNEALAKVAQQFVKKGARLYVQGELSTRKWTDDKGVQRWSTEVHLRAFNSALILLDRKPAEDGRVAA